jgi:glucokinase
LLFALFKQGGLVRVGVDLGGTKIAVGLVDDSGTVIGRKRSPTLRDRGYAGVRDAVILLIRELLQEQNIPSSQLSSIGVAAAGQMDGLTQKILFAPNLGWVDVPLKEDIESALGVRVRVENDVNAATYGEWRFGSIKHVENLVGIFIGTGIGGGLILGGTIYKGFSNVGGELGHITLNPWGYRCNCGNTGCFEAYCGGLYITSRIRQRIEEGYRGRIWDLIDGDIESLHPGHVEEAAALGDELCARAWREVVEYLGAALQSIANLLNPEVIILGGRVILGTTRLIDESVAIMRRRAMPPSIEGLKIERATLEEDATILGVAFMDEQEQS